jgi:hypothetical protein
VNQRKATLAAIVLQWNIHPASRGFHWWKDVRPAGLAGTAAFFSNLHPNTDCRPLIAVSI